MASEEVDGSLSVSIGILCYNQKDIIGRIIEAALQQTHTANEILVVDDGSSDGSDEVIKSYPGVKVLLHPHNQGRTAARNTLLQAAQSDVLVYLDGDTVPDASLLQFLLPEYSSPEVGIVGSNAIEQNIQTVADRWRAQHGFATITQRVEDALEVYGAGFSCRRLLALELGGFRRGGEEVDMCFRVRKAGYRIVYTPFARVYHLRSDTLQELRRTAYRWSFGGYVAYARNGRDKLWPQAQVIWQKEGTRCMRALFVEHDVARAFVHLYIMPTQIKALYDGRQFLRSGQPHWPKASGI